MAALYYAQLWHYDGHLEMGEFRINRYIFFKSDPYLQSWTVLFGRYSLVMWSFTRICEMLKVIVYFLLGQKRVSNI